MEVKIQMTAAVKPYKGFNMEGPIARWYAASTGKSREDYAAEARRVAALLSPGASVLEVAPGPGYFAIELARLGPYRVTGLDISRSFVGIARRNAADAGLDVRFRLGSASAMPLDAASFDFVFCRAAFKNFSEPVRALQEMHRVLKPGGRALIVDLRRDADPESIRQMVAQMRLGGFDAWFTRLSFRFLLTRRAYTRPEIERFLAQTPFRSFRIDEGPVGMDIWLDKQDL